MDTVFTIFFLFLSSSLSCFSVNSLMENPFSPRASLIRYWNSHVSTTSFPQPPPFLLHKASLLSPVQSAFFARLASQNSLSSHLPVFCASANLLCSLHPTPARERRRRRRGGGDANFVSYSNKAFSNYGSSRLGGADAFATYSEGSNFAATSFARYSRAATGHGEGFAAYAGDANVAAANFTSYAAASGGGSGDFTSYMPRTNVLGLRFASYVPDADGHPLAFGSYADDANSGGQAFAGYGKNTNAAPSGFTSYANSSNVVESSFDGYGESGNGANDSFKAYAANANNPSNNFKSYGTNGNGGLDGFTSYRDSANAGRETFQTYGRSSNSENTTFSNYGNSFNLGSDTFNEYAKGSFGQTIGFNIYHPNTTFKDYAKKDGITITFARYYTNRSKIAAGKGNHGIEEGKFFRESSLKEGTVMRMPDIRDRMPKRSFLPPSIVSKLPFSTDELPVLKRTFRATNGSDMALMLENALVECERAPSPGETKRCVGSAEGMIDFAVSVLGSNTTLRTTEGVSGCGRDVIIGRVDGIDGGRITKSVSCHQSLYPYLLYYCHSVPKVRVYEADILDAETRVKINRGVAICHLNTSAWSPTHDAFLALGPGPGGIEVCHWIFENDVAWTKAD